MKMKNATWLVVAHTSSPSTGKTEAGGSRWVWGQPGLHIASQDSQGYTETYSEKQKRRRERMLLISIEGCTWTVSQLIFSQIRDAYVFPVCSCPPNILSSPDKSMSDRSPAGRHGYYCIWPCILLCVVAHALKPWSRDRQISLSLRTAWSTELIPRLQGNPISEEGEKNSETKFNHADRNVLYKQSSTYYILLSQNIWIV